MNHESGIVHWKTRFSQAAIWSLGGHALAQMLRFASNLILTRLLAPDMFGVMAVGYMVFSGLVMLSDLGASAFVTQSRNGDSPHVLNVVWVVQILRGVVVSLAALALAAWLEYWPPTSWLPAHSVYADPRLPSVIAVVSLYGLVSGFESTKSWLATRRLAVRTLTKIELASQVSTTLFIVCWAWISPSLWALAAGWVFGVLVRTVLSHLVLPGPSNRFEFDRAIFRDVFAFGKWALVSSPITFFVSSGDRLILGYLLDARVVGLYSIAMLLVSALKEAVSRILAGAAMPALAEIVRQRPEELRQALYRIRRPLDAACCVPAGMLFAMGPLVIRILYDHRYEDAGWMLSLLSLTLLALPYTLFESCLIAMGRVKRLSGLKASGFVILYSLLPAAYWGFGVKGAIAALPVVSLLYALLLLAMQARMKLLELKRELFIVLWFALGVTLGWTITRLLG
jgi:O-antigen/teichoic acid export membrane protein